MVSTLNSVILTGRLGKDPEVKAIGENNSVANFSLASNHSKKSGNGWTEETSWFDVAVFGSQASLAERFLRKGSMVTVQGRLQQNSWEVEGEKRYRIVVIGDALHLPPRSSEEGHVEAETKPSSTKTVRTRQPSRNRAAPAAGEDEEDDGVPF